MSPLRIKTRKLFQHLHTQWMVKPDLEPSFLDTLDSFNDLQKNLRADERLADLSGEMYPAAMSDATSPSKAEQARQELHEILHIVQTMESAWLGANLDRYDSHPLNGGWVAVFHRWASMPTFRRLWPIVRCDFSRNFVEYCESRFSLKVSYSELQPWNAVTAGNENKAGKADDNGQEQKIADPEVERAIRREFSLEWPEIGSAFLDSRGSHVWYVTPSICIPNESGDLEPHDLASTPLGFIALLSANSADSVRPCRIATSLRSDSRLTQRAQSARNEWPPSESSHPLELRVWVRPQHRYLDVGRHLMRELARMINERNDGADSDQESGDVPMPSLPMASQLLTKYFERTGQSKGRDLRRQMQLGFLYDYSFRRQNSKSRTSHDTMLQGRTAGKNALEGINETVLETTVQDFIEASRALS